MQSRRRSPERSTRRRRSSSSTPRRSSKQVKTEAPSKKPTEHDKHTHSKPEVKRNYRSNRSPTPDNTKQQKSDHQPDKRQGSSHHASNRSKRELESDVVKKTGSQRDLLSQRDSAPQRSTKAVPKSTEGAERSFSNEVRLPPENDAAEPTRSNYSSHSNYQRHNRGMGGARFNNSGFRGGGFRGFRPFPNRRQQQFKDDDKNVIRLIDPTAVPKGRRYFDHDDRQSGGGGRPFSDWRARGSREYQKKEENWQPSRSSVAECNLVGVWRHDLFEKEIVPVEAEQSQNANI